MSGRKMKTYSVRWLSFLMVLMVIFGGTAGGAYALYNTQLFAEPAASEIDNNDPLVSKSGNNAADINDPTAGLIDADDESYNFLFVGVDESEVLTDVMMMINMDTKKKRITVLQIPRDTYVGEEEAGSGTGKINAVYAHPLKGKNKIETLASYINHKLKVSIDYYATIDIDGFIEVVDIIGGVTLEVPQDIVYDGRVAIPKGVQTLNGQQSEWFIRFRKGYYDGDIGRQKAQIYFLKGLMNKMFEVTPKQAASIASQSISKVTTNMTVNDMVGFYNDVLKIGKNSVEFTRIPGDGINNWGPMHQAVYGVDTEELADILNEYFRPNSPDVLASELGFLDVNDMKAQVASQGKTTMSAQDELDEDEDGYVVVSATEEEYTSYSTNSPNGNTSQGALSGNPGVTYSSDTND